MFSDFPLLLAQDNAPPAADALPGTPAGDGGNGGDGAATTQQPANTNQNGMAPGEERPPSMFDNMWIILMIFLVVWVVLMFSQQRKEKRKKADMLSAIAKGARVQTVGGVLGTVMDVRGDEIVLKVDENTNTRMRFARSAVQQVLEEKQD